ncbi:RAVE protein 1 C terminal-domain-containing protein [Phycomyces blakesleeanus]|uniref:RAVE protein 1 C terminal-domain-containing protein n=1 Tax=Phycomyces blakesleeanus TaxID=4837 RepID=A0ABR3BIX6_PHYBL
MFLEQICPGQVNPQFHCIHTFTWRDERYIVYATGSKVVIYADPDVLVQIIPVPFEQTEEESHLETITAVSGNSRTGKLAVAYQKHICFFRSQEQKDDKKQSIWEIETVLSTKSQVTCLDWSVNDLLLTAGSELAIWKNTSSDTDPWKIQWTTRPAVDVIMAKFEPKSTMFATLGEFDRLVTVWHETAEGDYSFIHLPHPRSVGHFVWRTLLEGSKTKRPDCALFTMARDGIGRFWSPVDLETPHALYMCAVIDPSQSLVTAESGSMASQDGSVAYLDHIEDVSPIHYIDCGELQSAISTQPQYQSLSQSKQEKLDQRIKKVRDLIKETPDLLFRIQSDGSLTFWGVKHLNSFPRRVPRVFVVLRIAQAVDPADVAYFLNPVKVLHDYSHIQSFSTIKPIELSLVARNPHGQIRCYGLNLVDFLEQNQFIPRLHLKYTWLGHRNSIKSLPQSRSSRFCTIGEDGQINVWKYALREDGGKLTNRLQLSGSLSLESDIVLSIPVHRDRHVAVYNGKQLLIYRLDNQACHLNHYQVCEQYDPTVTFSSLHTEILRGDSQSKIHILFGVSRSAKQIFSWQLQFTSPVPVQDQQESEENESLEDIIFLGSQEFDWEEEPSVVVTSHGGSNHAASKLLQQIGMGADSIPIITVALGTKLLFYGIHYESDWEGNSKPLEWNLLYTLETGLESIQQMRCVVNQVVLVSSSETYGPSRKLTFWSEIRTGVRPVLHKTFEFSEPIIAMAWNVSCDAQFILAVAFPTKVAIYGQKRATSVTNDDDIWICYDEFPVDMPESIVGITWVENGVLAVAAGNQLRCYLKWLTSEDELNQPLDLDPDLHPMSNIYDLSYDRNGPLTIYHPNYLIHYMMWGKMDLINSVLRSLYKFLRHYVDEDTIDQIPPLLLSKILQLQNSSKKESKKQQYKSLFDDDDDNDTDYSEYYDDDDDSRSLSHEEANYLMEHLKSKKMPALSENERMHLVAMIDTFDEVSTQGEALDENGARFTALLENHFHLNNIISQDQQQALAARDFVWALHSQSQDLLLERCIRLCNNKLMWEEAKSLGIFLWLKKIDTVKEQMGVIARNTYLSKEDFKDPESCTLFYLALRKKNLLLGLWRSAGHHKEQVVMTKFLSNDFTLPRWKTAASKNAYVLLGRQRFEYAAAFFLLGDKIKDAVGIILKHMKDFQLAIAICRVYEGDHSPLLKDILVKNVLPMAVESNDRWLASMCYTLLERPQDAIHAIVTPVSMLAAPEKIKDTDANADADAEETAPVGDPTLFILYQQLKQQLQAQNRQDLNVPYSLEYEFSLQVARAYERLGCPLLSLYILTQYKMKPPAVESEQNIPQTSDKAADLFGDDNTPSTRPGLAANLFDDDDAIPSRPSYSANLFDDDTPPRPSYSANLFDDDDVPPSRPSYATDLFADEEPYNSPTDDLFADDPSLFENNNPSNGSDPLESSSQNSKNTSDSPERKNETVSIKDGLSSYKALLVIRMLQTVFRAASALYDSSVRAGKDLQFQTTFLQNRQDLLALGETLNVPQKDFSRLLIQKSIEADAFVFYLAILEKGVPEGFNVAVFLESFEAGCFQVFEAAMMPCQLGYSGLVFIERWADHLISNFGSWSSLKEKYPTRSSILKLGTQKLVLTNHLCLILVTLKQRHFEKTWGLLYYLKSLMECMAASKRDTLQKDVKIMYTDLLANTAKMVEMTPEDFESFSDDSLFGFDLNEEVYRPLEDVNDNSIGANLLEIASLNFTLNLLESSMQNTERSVEMEGDFVAFIWTTLLDPIAYRAQCLQKDVLLQMEETPTKRNILKQFKTLRQKKYWRSIKTLSSTERLLPFVNFLPSGMNVMSNDSQPHSHTMYYSPTTTHAFCISSAYPTMMAICMKTEIQEVDLSKVQGHGPLLARSGSGSSSGVHQELAAGSYPDTEEEEDDFGLSDGESEVVRSSQSSRHTKRKEPRGLQPKTAYTTSPALSPAAGRIQAEDRPFQNRSLENLHEALKRSLGMENFRSPGAMSPMGSSSENSEHMVTLKRSVSTTCAEAHPQFPFYITGCQSSNGSPSAILWPFGQEREIANYYGSQGAATRIHFDQFGQKFGMGDTSGWLSLWKFDSHTQSDTPYYTMSCHSKATRDFAFLGSSSLLATVGTSVAMSRRKDHVCLWDTLLPPSKAQVASLPGHDGGAYAVAFDSSSNYLFSGGSRGEIVVSDIRQRTLLHTFSAHQSRIRSIAIDTEKNLLVTGSTDGELKIWDIRSYKQKYSFDNQPRNRFLGPSFNRISLKAYGVTQIQLTSDDNIYTSGPGGIVNCDLSAIQ